MKTPMALLMAGLILSAGGLGAEEYPEDYDATVLEACLSERPPSVHADCIGHAADHCMQSEAGSSTLGVGICLSAEWQQWDARLNTAYQALLIQQAQVAEDNAAFNENIPNAVERMRDMQRKWIAYRDAACEWEYVQWGGGTGAGPASAACLMRLTALQTLFLEARL